jgi:hypothetical protein
VASSRGTISTSRHQEFSFFGLIGGAALIFAACLHRLGPKYVFSLFAARDITRIILVKKLRVADPQ